MKKQIVFFNTISIILLNIIFWVCNYYPRHLFEFGSVNTVIATILNFIYFIGYFFVLYIFFVKNKTFFSENIFNTFQPFKEQIDIKKHRDTVVKFRKDSFKVSFGDTLGFGEESSP